MKAYTREQIERAFARAEADPRFRFGAYKGTPDKIIDWKRFVVEMYERMSGEDVFEEEASFGTENRLR